MCTVSPAATTFPRAMVSAAMTRHCLLRFFWFHLLYIFQSTYLYMYRCVELWHPSVLGRGTFVECGCLQIEGEGQREHLIPS